MECLVCLDNYSDFADDYWVTTDCGYSGNGIEKLGHIFHKKCLEGCLKNGIKNCPICRRSLRLAQATKLSNMEVLPKPNPLPFDHEFKIVILGRFSVGKTSIVNRFAKNEFEELHTDTTQPGEWDTAGQEQYRSIVANYMKGAFGMIYVYDITDKKTFEEITDWVNFANKYGPQKSLGILVGNKLDLEAKRKVSVEQGEEFANRLKMSFLECSAKESFNISEIFRVLAFKILNDPDILEEADLKVSTLRVKEEPVNARGCLC